jgi:hypothetical protein
LFGQDCQERIAWTRQLEQDSLDRTGRKGLNDRKDSIVRKGQPE